MTTFKSKKMTLREFFDSRGIRLMWFRSSAVPLGTSILRDEPCNGEEFEGIMTNPDFWQLMGTVDDVGWTCDPSELVHCCDYQANDIYELAALPGRD